MQKIADVQTCRSASPRTDWSFVLIKQLIKPNYGLGEVVALIEPKKVGVLFADRIQRLIRSRV